MVIDATFWVAVSFFIFVIILIYFKIPQKVNETLNKLSLQKILQKKLPPKMLNQLP